MKKISIQFVVLALGLTHLMAQTPKESSLWGSNGENWDPKGRLPDFSYAGYHSCEKDLPTGVPVVANLDDVTNANDSGDDSQKLKDLINAQSTSANNPGVILIPKGRWVINNAFSFNKSGIILQGEVDASGKPLTEFYFPRSHPNHHRDWFIKINGNHSRSKLGEISNNRNQGDNTFNINYSSGARFQVGDMLQLVQNDPSSRSLSQYLHGGQSMNGITTSNSFFPDVFYWYAKVTAVSGNSVTVDRTLPIDVKTAWRPEVFKFNPAGSTSEIGFENIKFVCNNNKAFKHGKPREEEPGFLLVRFSKVVNCWMKNVEFIDADAGVRFDGESTHNTLRKLVFQDVKKSVSYPRWEDRSSRGYIYDCQQRAGLGHHPVTFWHAYYNLMEDFEFKDVYWHELSVEGAAAYNVFRDGKGPAVAFDNHAWMPYSNLWTNIDIGRQERLWFNSGKPERGHKAGWRNTYWNITYDYLETRQGIESASNNGFRQLNLIGYARGRSGHSSHLVEVTGTNEKIAQPDLFLAQLCKRGKCGGPVNKLVSAPVPTLVEQGQTVIVPVQYSSAGTNQILVLFQLGEAPWTGFANETVEVISGSGTVDVEITIPLDVPVATDAYQFQVVLSPLNGGWEERFDNIETKNISVKEKELKGPYSGTPIAIPGTLELEDYDKGGADVSYKDNDEENRGSEYRMDGVDITTRTPSGFSVGWIGTGEWLEYTVDVEETANYNLTVHYGANSTDAKIGMTSNGADLFKDFALPTTGGFNDYSTTVKELVSLSEGEQVLRLNVEKNGFNIDKIEFVKAVVSSLNEKSDSESILVYPNPNKTGIFHLTQSVSEWSFKTIQGTELRTGSGKEINVEDLEKGVYIISLPNNLTKKVVIE